MRMEKNPNIFSQMVVNDSDESHGTIRKKNHQLNKSHLAVLDPEKKRLNGLFSLLNMESPKVQKVSHWLSKKSKFLGARFQPSINFRISIPETRSSFWERFFGVVFWGRFSRTKKPLKVRICCSSWLERVTKKPYKMDMNLISVQEKHQKFHTNPFKTNSTRLVGRAIEM